MEGEFDDVWYATPEWFRSRFQWAWRSDRGRLIACARRLEFRGTRHQLEILAPKRISVVRGRILWKHLIVGFLPFLFLATLGVIVLQEWTSSFRLLVFTALTFAIGAHFNRVRWLEVEYTDYDGRSQHAYFTCGESRFFSRQFFAVEDLRQNVCRVVFASTAPERPEAAPFWQGNIVRICDNCGHENLFSSRERGRVHDCSNCGAYLDVPAAGEVDRDPE
jgi:hypothetical protein